MTDSYRRIAGDYAPGFEDGEFGEVGGLRVVSAYPALDRPVDNAYGTIDPVVQLVKDGERTSLRPTYARALAALLILAADRADRLGPQTAYNVQEIALSVAKER